MPSLQSFPLAVVELVSCLLAFAVRNSTQILHLMVHRHISKDVSWCCETPLQINQVALPFRDKGEILLVPK